MVTLFVIVLVTYMVLLNYIMRIVILLVLETHYKIY